MNLATIISELKNEQAAGEQTAAEMVERIDRHIRDLEMFKAWVKDSAMVRSVSLAGMLGGDTTAPVASPPQQDEAA